MVVWNVTLCSLIEIMEDVREELLCSSELLGVSFKEQVTDTTKTT
jgi:hypothetical protein